MAERAADMPALELAGVSHAYGRVKAMDAVALTVEHGEVVCLVGPSGCGKTTLLRVAAGLEALQSGVVRIGGRTVAEPGRVLPPERRGVGMVFQDFALFPHLTVAENVGFGLHDKSSAERRQLVSRVLAQFNVSDLGGAYPHMLSGGQQQRVALARALAPGPRVVMLDEPFSGLDSRLRDRVRDETLHLLKNSGAAALLVTHDPEEAMFMADRIAVMREGRVEQVGRPVDIYFHPQTAFVTTFFSDVNRLTARVAGGKVATPFGCLGTTLSEGCEAQVLIRPEALHLAWTHEDQHGANVARVTAARLLGRSTLIHLELPVGSERLHLHSRVPRHVAFAEGDEVAVRLDESQAFVFPAGDTTSE